MKVAHKIKTITLLKMHWTLKCIHNFLPTIMKGLKTLGTRTSKSRNKCVGV